MLNYALPLVTTLHIEKASQPRVGVISGHLRDVRSVSIYNLFSLPISGDIELDEDIATKSVKFIIGSKFPHLESIAFWGKSEDRLHSLNMSFTSIHNVQKRSIHNLMDSFSGAFDCGSLPQNLQIVGLRCPRKRRSGTSNSDCAICKRVCDKFPLELIGDVDLCLQTSTSNEIIESRKGGRSYLHSETRFMQLLSKCRCIEASRNDCCIVKYSSRVKDELKNMVESSKLDASKLNLEDVAKAIKKQYPNIPVYLTGQSFDYLKSIGIQISNDLLNPDVVRSENLDRMVRSVMEETGSLFSPVDGLNKIKCLLRKQDPPIERVVKSGVLPKVVELLRRYDDDELQLAATGIVLNVAAVKREHVETIVKLGAIPPLVSLLGSTHTELPFDAAWALGNIAGDWGEIDFGNLVLQAGVMQPLLKLLEDNQTNDVKSLRRYVWTLTNICFSGKGPEFKKVTTSLNILKKLLYHTDEEVLNDTCWALNAITEGPTDVSSCRKELCMHRQATIDVLKEDGICRLIELLEHPKKAVKKPVLRLLGLLSSMKSQTQIIIGNNALHVCLLFSQVQISSSYGTLAM